MDLDRYRKGIALFNRAEYFEAHEVLEDVWRASPGPEKKFLQGLIQVAVALHHHSRGNKVGACSLLKRACRNVASAPKDALGIDLKSLLQSLHDWQTALADNQPVPPAPKL